MKVLFLVPHDTYLTKLCRARFIAIEALSKLCDVHTSGLGWLDYDSNLTVQQNIDNMNQNFDFIVTYQPLKLKNIDEVKIPKCILYNEMYDVNKTLNEIQTAKIQLVICHHLNDYNHYSNLNLKITE